MCTTHRDCQTPPVKTPPVTLRPATDADTPSILSWNEADVHFLSAIDQARLAYISAVAGAVEIVEVGGRAAGFIITFLEGSDYDSENYRWFSEREPQLHYIDRVVIDPAFRGQGVATRVYATLAERFPTRPLLAEVNFAPPNPASIAFHTACGFDEVGRLGDQTYGVILFRRYPQTLSTR